MMDNFDGKRPRIDGSWNVFAQLIKMTKLIRIENENIKEKQKHYNKLTSELSGADRMTLNRRIATRLLRSNS